jgi:cobalt-zinc-cadmium efflux system protein
MKLISSHYDPMSAASASSGEPSKRPITLLWIVLGLRSGLFLAELSVGLWVHSRSLLAVAGHMMVDVFAIAIALIAAEVKHHSSPERNSHANQVEAGSALVNGLLLLGIAALIAWNLIEPSQTPETSAGLPMLIMAGLGFLVKGVNASLLYEESHHSLNVRGVFLHAIIDAVNSISLLLAALAMIFLNWLWADAIASLLVILFILVNAFSLLWDSLAILRKGPNSE